MHRRVQTPNTVRNCARDWLFRVVALLAVVTPASAAEELTFDLTLQRLQNTCGECHADGAEEGGFSLEELASADSLREEYERWHTIQRRITDLSMPPADSEPLPTELREALIEWIDSATLKAICEQGPTPGPPLLRRLARHEYSNTIRDLLGIHFDAGQGLPEDTAGGEGFTNAAETLIISPIHAEKYLQAATDALNYAAHDEGARQRLLPIRPSEDLADVEAARQNLANLTRQAFRRPVEADEVNRYVQIYEDARADGVSFDDAVLYAMRGILISPSFLFILEAPPSEPGVSEPLTDHELAVRLSYFLSASTPDAELRSAADAGTLHEPEELKRQTIRLLTAKGTHVLDSMEHFVGNWLGTADLGRSKKVDREKHPWIEEPHVAALRDQPVYAMRSVLKENGSILELIDAPWTFMNDELARVYRIRKNEIEDDFVQNLTRIDLPEKYRYRGGLLGMGGPMAVSAYPRRSSPVLRGAWVLEKLLGVELPPPPPDVPALDESETAVAAATLRERFEQHRALPACATCHDRIDPLGFALENFDEIGRWRDKDAGGPIDAVAELPDGTRIDGPAGLKEYVLSEKQTFARVLTRKMLGYALGRSLRPADLCTVETIVQRLKQNDYRSHELVLGIVTSETFVQKRAPVEELMTESEAE